MASYWERSGQAGQRRCSDDTTAQRRQARIWTEQKMFRNQETLRARKTTSGSCRHYQRVDERSIQAALQSRGGSDSLDHQLRTYDTSTRLLHWTARSIAHFTIDTSLWPIKRPPQLPLKESKSLWISLVHRVYYTRVAASRK